MSHWNDAIEEAWTLESALLKRFGALPTGDIGVTLRTDNALVYGSKVYHKFAKSYGLLKKVTLPHSPKQNGVAESFMGRASSNGFGSIASKHMLVR